jgi:hypothetical protein
MSDNLKVVWAEFSTLSWVVLCQRSIYGVANVQPLLELKTRSTGFVLLAPAPRLQTSMDFTSSGLQKKLMVVSTGSDVKSDFRFFLAPEINLV